MQKKYNSKKWWSCGVVELLLQMHFAYTSEFSGGAQTGQARAKDLARAFSS